MIAAATLQTAAQTVEMFIGSRFMRELKFIFVHAEFIFTDKNHYFSWLRAWILREKRIHCSDRVAELNLVR